MSRNSSARSRPIASVKSWFQEVDVLVVGLGGAGASAAISAADTGASVLVVEVAGAGGGSTALAGGQIYLGGGTPTQLDCGVDDSLEEMYQFLLLACGPNADTEKVRHYVDNNLDHFQWLLEQGMEFKPELVSEKLINTLGDEGLICSGNEYCYPYDSIAKPAPRGHKGKAFGERGGALLMDKLISSARSKGVQFLYEARGLAAIVDDGGTVVGLVVRIDDEERCIAARGGVVLCTGGFIMNTRMVAQHAPRLAGSNYPLGNPNDTGDGIRIGQAAGGIAINMHEGFISLPFYPPSELVEAIVINGKGQRVIAEDCYHGRMGDLMFAAPEEKFFLVVDSGQFEALEKPPLAGFRVAEVAETIEELQRGLGLPEDTLARTLEFYNQHAAANEDPLFHKRAPHLRPLDKPPYAAFDISLKGGAYFPAFTFGGLDTRVTGEVLSAEGEVIQGLYAAGRTACGLPRCGATYSSGMSIGDATYFGRLAGMSAAQRVVTK